MKKTDSFYRGKKIMVTGGAGFIGSHLVEKLLALGASIVVLVSAKTDLWRLQSCRKLVKIVKVDLTDTLALGRIFLKEKPLLVFHLAGRIDNRQDVSILMEMFNANVLPALSLLDAARSSSVRRLILVGSGSEYGDQKAPFREVQRELPHSPYGLSKATATRFAELFAKLTGVDVVVARPSSVFGPRQGPGMLIPNLIAACLKKEDFHMSVAARKQVRDFLYVEDCVEGLLRMGSADKPLPFIINLGNRSKTKIADLASQVNDLMGRPITIRFDKPAFYRFDNPKYYMDTVVAQKYLNWRAMTPLEEALQKTIASYCAQTITKTR